MTTNKNTRISEMDDDYANGGYASMADSDHEISMGLTKDVASNSVVMGDPVSSIAPQNIYVSANAISACTYDAENPIASFDVVFSVHITADDGTSKTYQIIKRIGVDRKKIADEAMRSVPTSVIEAKQAPQEKFLISKERARQMAGLK